MSCATLQCFGRGVFPGLLLAVAWGWRVRMSGCGGVDALLSYTKSACCEINVAERGPMLHAWPCCGAKPILLYIVIFLISTGPVCTGPTCEPWIQGGSRRSARPRQPGKEVSEAKNVHVRKRTCNIFGRNSKTKIGHQSGRQGADSGDTLCPHEFV